MPSINSPSGALPARFRRERLLIVGCGDVGQRVARDLRGRMASGQLLRVVSTDPGSVRDFQAFARQTGNELMEQQTVGGDFIHVLKRR